jgi:MYXO-CTERM domain-containing protein
MGTLTFSLNGGSALKKMFQTLTDYVLAVMAVAPGANTAALQDEYQHEVLARDYEMLFDAPSNSQVCVGDWGGPLLQKDAAGIYRVFGAASGSRSYGSTSRCYFGSVYATFGPATLAFFERIGALPFEDGGILPPLDGGWTFDAFPPVGVGGAGGLGGGGLGGGGGIGVAGSTASGSGGYSGGYVTTTGAAGTTTAGGAGATSSGRAGSGGGAGDVAGGVTNTTGCACRTGASEGGTAGWLALGGAIALGARRRRVTCAGRGAPSKTGGRAHRACSDRAPCTSTA